MKFKVTSCGWSMWYKMLLAFAETGAQIGRWFIFERPFYERKATLMNKHNNAYAFAICRNSLNRRKHGRNEKCENERNLEKSETKKWAEKVFIFFFFCFLMAQQTEWLLVHSKFIQFNLM